MLLSCALNYLPEPGRRGVAPAPEQAAPCLLLKTELKKTCLTATEKKVINFLSQWVSWEHCRLGTHQCYTMVPLLGMWYVCYVCV